MMIHIKHLTQRLAHGKHSIPVTSYYSHVDGASWTLKLVVILRKSGADDPLRLKQDFSTQATAEIRNLSTDCGGQGASGYLRSKPKS